MWQRGCLSWIKYRKVKICQLNKYWLVCTYLGFQGPYVTQEPVSTRYYCILLVVSGFAEMHSLQANIMVAIAKVLLRNSYCGHFFKNQNLRFGPVCSLFGIVETQTGLHLQKSNFPKKVTEKNFPFINSLNIIWSATKRDNLLFAALQ